MSQHQKLVAKLLTVPVPADFTWDELVRLLSGYGYKEDASGGGSHRRFMNSMTKATIFVPKPHHPNKVVGRAYLKQIIQHLSLDS